MPLLLHANFHSLWLENNDITFEVVTSPSDLEVKVYKTQREVDASEREWRSRTESSYNAFIWFVERERMNDAGYVESARSYFHIHMFAKFIYGKGLLIEKLLPKSGHDKGDDRVNLAEEPLERWDPLVANMSIRTKIAVERFRVHFVERFLIR